jgi:hypothetical protein
MAEDPVKADEVVPGNRLRAGAAIFVTGQLAPLAIPLVTNSSLPATWKWVLSGVLLLGVPELAINQLTQEFSDNETNSHHCSRLGLGTDI